MFPAEGFVNQRNTVGSAASEEDSFNWHTSRFLPVRVDDRTLGDWGTETRVGMCCLLSGIFIPFFTQPIRDCQLVNVGKFFFKT